MRIRRLLLPASVVVALALSACNLDFSPESGRARDGGPGADVGNRPANVQLHTGNEGLYETPALNPPVRSGSPAARSASAANSGATR